MSTAPGTACPGSCRNRCPRAKPAAGLLLDDRFQRQRRNEQITPIGTSSVTGAIRHLARTDRLFAHVAATRPGHWAFGFLALPATQTQLDTSADTTDLVRIEGVRGFKSPQLHREIAGQVACSSFRPAGWKPSRRGLVWLGFGCVQALQVRPDDEGRADRRLTSGSSRVSTYPR